MALVATGLFSLPNSHALSGPKYFVFSFVCVFGFRADFFVIGFSCKIWKSSIPLFLCTCAVFFCKKRKSILKNGISSLGIIFICTLVISRAEPKDQSHRFLQPELVEYLAVVDGCHK